MLAATGLFEDRDDAAVAEVERGAGSLGALRMAWLVSVELCDLGEPVFRRVQGPVDLANVAAVAVDALVAELTGTGVGE
jgi:hypothetical protein